MFQIMFIPSIMIMISHPPLPTRKPLTHQKPKTQACPSSLIRPNSWILSTSRLILQLVLDLNPHSFSRSILPPLIIPTQPIIQSLTQLNQNHRAQGKWLIRLPLSPVFTHIPESLFLINPLRHHSPPYPVASPVP